LNLPLRYRVAIDTGEPEMSAINLTFPIIAGKVEAWRRFCQEMSGSRLPMYEASRWRLGITHEQLALMDTPFGSRVMARLEARDMGQALGQLIASEDPFDIWYRAQLQELHGVVLAANEPEIPQPATPQKQVVHFEWHHNSEVNN
jgi:hypothetical protein